MQRIKEEVRVHSRRRYANRPAARNLCVSILTYCLLTNCKLTVMLHFFPSQQHFYDFRYSLCHPTARPKALWRLWEKRRRLVGLLPMVLQHTAATRSYCPSGFAFAIGCFANSSDDCTRFQFVLVNICQKGRRTPISCFEYGDQSCPTCN